MRNFIIAAAAMVLGCAAFAAQAQTSGVTLRVASFGGLFGEVERIYVGDRMTRETGVKVAFSHGNPSDTLAKLLASKGREPPFDVVLLDAAVQKQAIAAGLLAKLDPAQVPNLKNVYPMALDKDGYGPMFLLYTVGLVYNRDKLKEAGIAPPKSWNDLWNPKLAGHISIPDIGVVAGTDFLIQTNHLNGGNEKNLRPGLDKLAQLHPNSYYYAPNTVEQLLVSGDVWMAPMTSGLAWTMIDKGYPLGYVVPSEGSVAGVDTIEMVAGTPHAKEAQHFINMQIDPVTQIGLAAELNYGPTNSRLSTVFQSYPELAKKRVPSSPADLAKLYNPDWLAYNAGLKQTVDYWNRSVKH